MVSNERFWQAALRKWSLPLQQFHHTIQEMTLTFTVAMQKEIYVESTQRIYLSALEKCQPFFHSVNCEVMRELMKKDIFTVAMADTSCCTSRIAACFI